MGKVSDTTVNIWLLVLHLISWIRVLGWNILQCDSVVLIKLIINGKSPGSMTQNAIHWKKKFHSKVLLFILCFNMKPKSRFHISFWLLSGDNDAPAILLKWLHLFPVPKLSDRSYQWFSVKAASCCRKWGCWTKAIKVIKAQTWKKAKEAFDKYLFHIPSLLKVQT